MLTVSRYQFASRRRSRRWLFRMHHISASTRQNSFRKPFPKTGAAGDSARKHIADQGLAFMDGNVGLATQPYQIVRAPARGGSGCPPMKRHRDLMNYFAVQL